MWHIERVIRLADPARDAAACAAIYAPYVTDSVASFEEVPPDAAAFAEQIEQLNRSHAFVVCEREGRVAGYAYGGPHRARAAYRWAADVSVYVHADFHRAGVGRELYDDLFGRLRAQGFRVLGAGITLPNAASVGLHESFGFEPVGVWTAIGWKFGAWRDVGWWRLQLASQEEDGEQMPEEPASTSG
jgi:phosphinothricin acetyltransferase